MLKKLLRSIFSLLDDYMITNPPFGVSWKSEEEFIKNESSNPQGRFSVGTPRSSDGSL
jgi:type I restriction enzyme M protein